MKIGTSKAVEVLKLVFHLTGLWSTNASQLSTIIYNLYSYFILLFLFVYDVTLTGYIFIAENTKDATEALGLTIFVITLLGRVLNFKIHQRGIQNLILDVEQFQLETSDEVSFMNRHISLYNKLIFCYFIFANTTAILLNLTPFFSETFRLPYLAWYPFDWQCNRTTYILLFVYQVFGMNTQSNISISMDLFPTYLMYVASLKLKVLGARIEKLSEIQARNQSNRQSMNANMNKLYIDELVNCIVAYQQICKYIKLTEKYFTYGYFILITTGAGILCSGAYQISTISPHENTGQFVFMIFYLICFLTEIFMPCYLGNEIILKHENLTRSVFKCGWHYNSSMEYRRIVIIFMELIKEKRQILVGYWFPLNLDTFTSIINFTYRLYTVLVQTA